MTVDTTSVARTPFSPRVATFLGAEAISAIGTWATIVAIWGYAAYEYDATAAEIGLFGLAFSFPPVLLGPLTGTIVDRIGPKATLALSKIIGIAAALALLSAHDFRTLTILSAFHGTSSALQVPALQSMPPRLVAADHLARTNALVGLTDELAIVLGPVAAGVGIAAFGFRGAFVFDALTYALGLVVLPMVHLRAVRHDADDNAPAKVRFRDTFEGWRLVGRSRMLRRTVACTLAVHLLYGASLLSEPLYVRDVLHRSPGTFAALQTVFGIALVAGGVVAARVGERMATFGWVAAGVLLSGLTSIVYLGTSWVGVAFIGVGLWGVATALISGPSRTVLQRSSPERAHGRVMSADLVAGSTGELIGLGVAGVVVGAFGVRWSALGLGLVITFVAAALWEADRRDTPHPGGDTGATHRRRRLYRQVDSGGPR
jgi:predicted MFS family arabinose efflux permease